MSYTFFLVVVIIIVFRWADGCNNNFQIATGRSWSCSCCCCCALLRRRRRRGNVIRCSMFDETFGSRNRNKEFFIISILSCGEEGDIHLGRGRWSFRGGGGEDVKKLQFDALVVVVVVVVVATTEVTFIVVVFSLIRDSNQAFIYI